MLLVCIFDREVQEKGAELFSVREVLNLFIILSLKDSVSSGTWGKPSTPKTAALLSRQTSLYESAERCRISDIAAPLSDRYGG